METCKYCDFVHSFKNFVPGTKYPEILPGWNLEIEFILNCLDIHFDVTQFHGGVFTLKDLGLNNTRSASGLPGAWLIAIL